MHTVIAQTAHWLAPLAALLVTPPLERVGAAGLEKVRRAAVAGSFYPADPEALTEMIDALLAQVSDPPVTDPIVAAVAPHAGFPYSGPVAAHTFAALKERGYARVVVLAPSHYEAFNFISVFDGDGYATPLGTMRVDTAFARQLAALHPAIELSGRGHEPTQAGGEHAIEVQLPWLQRVLGDLEIVPIVMGNQSYRSSRALGAALAKLTEMNGMEDDTLVLASSDLSHFHPWDDAVTMDRKTLNALEEWDYFSMAQNFEARTWEACGGAPVVAAMIYAERMGANQARVLQYANSGDVTGDRSRVVGYSAAVFQKAPAEIPREIPFSLSDEEKRELLALARKSVEHAIEERHAYEPPPGSTESLNQERGAFVTLRKEGALRGCIGYSTALKPLTMTVRDTATLAAIRDPRFPAVTREELPRLEYEISVLSPLRRVLDIEQIMVGEHGLLIKNGENVGLLLPQVPVERNWDRTAFLEQTSVKAGLPPDGWRSEDTDIFSFTAIVFGEHPLCPPLP